MLARVEVTNNQGAVLALPLQDGVDGYVVQDIDGLDPVDANIVSTGFAQIDGEQYQASRREKRNIIIKLGLEAALFSKGTVKDLRNKLYQYLMPKSEVKLRFIDHDGSYVDINGRVETFASKLFTKDPEVTVGILCLQPDFYIPEPVIISGNTVSDTSEFSFEYEGTVDTGILFRLNANRDMTGLRINHRVGTGVVRTLEFTAPLSAGDVLEISTVSGAKGASLIRAGSTNPVLYGISTSSSWITLEQGTNYFRAESAGAAVPFDLIYTIKIGGL